MTLKLNIRKWILIVFLIVCIFFPEDPYGIKFITLFPLLLSGFSVLLYAFKHSKYSYILAMGGIYPVAIMIWSCVVGGNIKASISETYPPVLLLLVIIIVEYGISYEKIAMSLLKIMAIMTIGIVVLDIIGIINVNQHNFIYDAFYNYDMGLMGKSPSFAVMYKVFFKASPLMLILIPYCFEKNEIFMALITFIACVLSGTRANIFCAAIIFSFGLVNIWSDNKDKRALRILLGFLFLIVLFISVPSIIVMVQNMMNAAGSIGSDAVRSGQFNSFKNVFKNPIDLLFGMGFGSSFFDSGRMIYAMSSEIAYFDLLRKIGLICFLPFILFVVKPFTWRMQVHYKVAYAGYLMSCFTNPLLFSSTAYVLYILLYTNYYFGIYNKQMLKTNI